jgi:hypothetical protein
MSVKTLLPEINGGLLDAVPLGIIPSKWSVEFASDNFRYAAARKSDFPE